MTSLDLRCNDFETLPEGILGLVRVKWINLENSNMNSLPDGIGGMKELESIYMRYNKLRSLPHVYYYYYYLGYWRLSFTFIFGL